ncbi:hypothetical protein ILUMI_02835 [Ignelater luminosus]|uniref:Aminoacyl-tRNA synthetase class I anticodon-binding domain-containing protein n=1 Tax=Ignelater luminosus TaxID=2038154 RepID=A0A8K0DBW4_IGNLU|nr:hypothetical protein ILUMI_02835 [Ignelater luminosus]
MYFQFDVKKINSHSGKLMPERLQEFNRLEIERQLKNDADLKLLVIKVQNIIKEKFPDRISDNSLKLDEEYIKSILLWSSNRIDRLSDVVSNQLAFLWISPTINKNKNVDDLLIIEKLKERLKLQEDLTKEKLKPFLKSFSQQNNVKFSNLMQLVRSILSGLKEGPSVAEMIEILGKENTLLRLQTYIKKNSNNN